MSPKVPTRQAVHPAEDEQDLQLAAGGLHLRSGQGIMMIIRMTLLTPSIRQIVNHTTMPTKLKLDIARIWDEKCAPRGYTR